MSPRISAYFSHSYRPEDREVNEYFWKLFWEAGFTFTVDPRSGRLSIPHVELLVRRNACFAAVVTYRPEEDHYQASPYIVFEYGLAVQADKPRLVFVDRRAARHHYEGTRRLVFDRDAIAEDRDRHVAAIRQLHDLGAAHPRSGDREGGSVGLVLRRDGAYGKAMPRIRDLLARAGYEVTVIDYEAPDPYRFIMEVDRHDFVVIDVGEHELPSWLHPFLYGHFVPMVRLVHHEPSGLPVESLPRLMLGRAIESVASTDELAIWWSSVDELLAKLDREVRALKLPPRGELRTREQGLGYFSSLGRSVDARVFVSNAGPENDFADELCRQLKAGSVRFFHYIFENTIELGRHWPDGLRDRLQASQLFLPLITPAYWESDACREEFRIAEALCKQGRLRILPYFMEPGGLSLPLQGRSLYRLPPDQRVERIMIDLDGYLTPRADDGAAALSVQTVSLA
jgi:TIR domain